MSIDPDALYNLCAVLLFRWSIAVESTSHCIPISQYFQDLYATLTSFTLILSTSERALYYLSPCLPLELFPFAIVAVSFHRNLNQCTLQLTRYILQGYINTFLSHFKTTNFPPPRSWGPWFFTLNCCNKYIKLPATLIMECISEAQRNLLDYDVTYEILYSINVYIIYM